jgi:hypothetical protein
MSFWNAILAVIVSLPCACAIALADEPPDVADESPEKTRVLLFRSGRALEGQIDETETHYVVTRATGTVEILKSEIEFVANDLDGAYRYKRERINDAKPTEHIRLAQWCLVVNLRDRAIEELERCVELDPNSTRAKGLLENLRRAAKPAAKSSLPADESEPAKPNSEPPTRTYPSFQKELSPAHVSTFSVQVQPLLLRSCGTAGCHDANHPGPLALVGSFRPSQRSSQKNLRAVLAQIDTEEPDTSPLLVESLRPHGAAHRSPFMNGLNDPAYAKLSDWVRAVSGNPGPSMPAVAQSREPAAAAVENAKPSSNPPGTETTAPNSVYSNRPVTQTPARARAGMVNSPTEAIGSQSSDKQTGPVSDATPGPQLDAGKPSGDLQPEMNPTAKPLARPAAPARSPTESYQPIDPFDPEVFNRQFAPR